MKQLIYLKPNTPVYQELPVSLSRLIQLLLITYPPQLTPVVDKANRVKFSAPSLLLPPDHLYSLKRALLPYEDYRQMVKNPPQFQAVPSLDQYEDYTTYFGEAPLQWSEKTQKA